MAGAWFDTKANKVVDARPEEGVQLISPDVEPTAGELEWVAEIAAAAEAVEAEPVVAAPVPEPEAPDPDGSGEEPPADKTAK